MGATLGKSKGLSISSKVNGQEKLLINGTTTLEKKNKKKKSKLSIPKSLDIKVDKFTATDGSAISASSSSAYIKQLVNGSGSNHHLYDGQMNSSQYSGTPSKDVLELRDACIRRGIISPDMNIITFPTSPVEQENPVEQSTDEIPPAIVITNNEEEEEQQQQEPTNE
jgi:hypothetical protein